MSVSKGSAAAYERLVTIPSNEVLGALIKGESVFSLKNRGLNLNLSSNRIKTFSKGDACIHCGARITFFAVERHKSITANWHLNPYHVTGDGKEVMITSDHILPKAKGGKDCLENRQPMCEPCNRIKGDASSVEEGIARNVLYRWGSHLRGLDRSLAKLNLSLKVQKDILNRCPTSKDCLNTIRDLLQRIKQVGEARSNWLESKPGDPGGEG